MSNTSRVNLVGSGSSGMQDLLDLVRTTQEDARHLVLRIDAGEYTTIPFPITSSAFPAVPDASPRYMLIAVPVIAIGPTVNEGAILSFRRQATQDEWYTGLWYVAEWYGARSFDAWSWELPTVAVGGDKSLVLLPRYEPAFLDIEITCNVTIRAFDVYFF